MSRARVPLPGVDLASDRLALPEAAAHHLVDVLRLEAGQAVIAFDGAGREVDASLAHDEHGWHLVPSEPPREGVVGAPVTLVYGLPKGEKLDLVVRQISELGVRRLVLVQMTRSVTRLKGDRAAKRVARLERVAREAARQAGRADVLHIEGPLSLAAAIEATADHPTRAVLEVSATDRVSTLPAVGPMAIWVGPEGGFDPSEHAALSAAGWQPICLGRSVLRTETAATVSCALALAHLGAL